MFSRISLKIDFTEQFNRFAAISNNLPQHNISEPETTNKPHSNTLISAIALWQHIDSCSYFLTNYLDRLSCFSIWFTCTGCMSQKRPSFICVHLYVHSYACVRTYITQSNPKNPFQGINLSLFAFLSLSCASFLRLLLLFLHTFFITSLFFSCFLMKKYVLLLLSVCQIAPTFSQLLPQHNRCLYVLFFYSFIPFGKCFILLPKSHNIKPESIYE